MFQNSSANKIIAIVSAIVLWIYVVGSVDPMIQQKYEGIPIQLINQDSLIGQDLAVYDTGDLFVDLVLKGSRAEISTLDESDIRVTADLYGRHVGKNYVLLDVQVPKGIRIESKSIEKVVVQIESLVSETRPIELQVNGKTASNRVIGKTEILPKEVTISGAKSSLKEVNKVVAQVDAKNLTQDINKIKSKIVPINDKGKAVNFVNLSSGNAEITAELDYLKEVKLNVQTKGKVDSAYKVDNISTPSKIWIQGSNKDLKEIEEIDAEDVDISDVTETTKLKIIPKLPKDVKLAKLSKDIGISITIAPQSQKDFVYTEGEMNIVNLDEEFTAEVKGSVTVTVLGSEDSLGGFDKGDLEIKLDLKGLEKGTHSVDIEPILNKNGLTVKLYPKEIKVVIK